MLRLLSTLAVVLLAGGLSPAHAKGADAPLNCRSAYGDIWGENIIPQQQRVIDGDSLKSPAALARATGTREMGLKIIKGGDFSGWNMRGMALSFVCFEDSKFVGANLAGAQGTGTGFTRADLTGANMQGAELSHVLFRNANLTNVQAQGADFSDGQLDGGWFEGAVAGWNLDGADMTGFVFACGITVPDGCPVYQGGDPISAKGVNFTGATLDSFGLYNMQLSGAKIYGTIISPSQISDLIVADLQGAMVLRGGASDIAVSPDEFTMLQLEYARRKLARDKPSFDCAKAQSAVEKVICAEGADDLRTLDRQISKLYAQAKSVRDDVKASQRRWLKDRNRCEQQDDVRDCVRQCYDRRKGQLLGALGESDWLPRGAAALFIDTPLLVSQSFADKALLAKITPALIGASRTEILVRRDANGLYAIDGMTVGANAHLCALSASSLYLDPTTGWYIPVVEGEAMPIFRIVEDRLEIFKSGRPDYQRYPDAEHFMSCGMRAGFSETQRIAADAATMARVEKSLTEER